MTPPDQPTTRKVIRFLQGWAINTFAVAVAAWLLRGISYDHGRDLLLASLLLGILNTFARPLLMFLALPLLVLTLGLFMLVINALLLLFIGQVVPGFHVQSFGWAVGGALVIGFTAMVLNILTGLGGARLQIRRAAPPRRPPGNDDGPVVDV